MKKVTLKLIIFGGSGNWASRKYFPVINKLNDAGFNIKVMAICDLIDPYTRDSSNETSLSGILEKDKPVWLNPNMHNFKKELDDFAKVINLVIISSNPVSHFGYINWALNNQINIVCDKPILVSKDSALNKSEALKIRHDYEVINEKYVAIKKKNSNYQFLIVVGRRAWKPFMHIFYNFEKVYKETNLGITHANIILNSGVHRFPGELLDRGAHGYLDGVGVVSHSAYHYIDILARMIGIMKDSLSKIKVTVPHVLRIKDYLDDKKYSPLDVALYKSKYDHPEINLSDSALNAELDCIAILTWYGKNDEVVGTCVLQFNNSTYTPRVSLYDSNRLNPDNSAARMHQLYVEIHQGPLQNWTLRQDHIFGTPNQANFVSRKHPTLCEKNDTEYQENKYHGEKEFKHLNSKDFIENILLFLAGSSKYDENMLVNVSSQKLSVDIFSAIYEAIAGRLDVELTLDDVN